MIRGKVRDRIASHYNIQIGNVVPFSRVFIKNISGANGLWFRAQMGLKKGVFGAHMDYTCRNVTAAYMHIDSSSEVQKI